MTAEQIVAEKLVEILREYGTAVLNDPNRCNGLLRDKCPMNKREINVLIQALEAGVPGRLNGGVESVAVLVPKLIRLLEGDYSLSAAPASWAVTTWAVALGLQVKSEMKVAVPIPTAADYPKLATEFAQESTASIASRTPAAPSMAQSLPLKASVATAGSQPAAAAQRATSQVASSGNVMGAMTDDQFCASLQSREPQDKTLNALFWLVKRTGGILPDDVDKTFIDGEIRIPFPGLLYNIDVFAPMLKEKIVERFASGYSLVYGRLEDDFVHLEFRKKKTLFNDGECWPVVYDRSKKRLKVFGIW